MPRNGREDGSGNILMHADDVAIASHNDDGLLLRNAHERFAPVRLTANRLLVEEPGGP